MNDTYEPDWKGENPYFLVIRQYEEEGPTSTVIDLNEKGWLTTYAHLMRVTGTWMLCSKAASEATGELAPVLITRVEDGEQPYYVARHIGVMSFDPEQPSVEVVCYGIGKKRVDGQVDRLWIMPNGMICGGEDVFRLASDLVKGQL